MLQPFVPLDQAALSEAARRVAAVEVAREVDAIAKVSGLTRLELAFESRALGLREEAMRRGPFDEQVAAALPILRAATLALDQFFEEWDVLLTPVLRTAVFKTGGRDQTIGVGVGSVVGMRNTWRRLALIDGAIAPTIVGVSLREVLSAETRRRGSVVLSN